jgi:hypothetical protein
MIIISTTAAIEAADGTINKPAKINILVKPYLNVTRDTRFTPNKECISPRSRNDRAATIPECQAFHTAF